MIACSAVKFMRRVPRSLPFTYKASLRFASVKQSRSNSKNQKLSSKQMIKKELVELKIEDLINKKIEIMTGPEKKEAEIKNYDHLL